MLSGRVKLHMFGAFDEFLRELIADRLDVSRATIYHHLDPDEPVSA